MNWQLPEFDSGAVGAELSSSEVELGELQTAQGLRPLGVPVWIRSSPFG